MNAECPPSQMLQEYLAGTLPPECVTSIEQHVDKCRSCAEILDTLEDESAHFISLLRNAASSGFPDVLGERQFEAAVRNLSSQSFLAAASRPATSDSTQTGRGNSDPDFRVHHSDSPAAANSGVCTDIDLPVTLGQYDLLEKIGQGGMGVVYRARHRKLNRVVAVKILSPLLTNDVGTVERFEGEMRAIGTLDHPNIVRALDASEVDGKHFLVMEYVDGTNLTDLVRSKGPLPVSEALQLIRQACRGLQHIYEAGMVHRDIKPRNLMLSSSGELRILDLGLALLTGFSDQHTESSSAAGHSGNDAKRHLTTAGKVMGTIDYIAPEQADNTHAVDIRADIYSLGCTLYFLLTGKAPFADRPALSIDDRMRQMKNEGPMDIRQHCPDVVPEVESLLNRMMELAPENRFLSPRDVLAALDAISTAQDGILTPGEPPPSEKQTIGPDRGHAGIIATVAIISGLAWVLLRWSEPAPELMTANPSSSEVDSESHLESKQPAVVLKNSTVEESASSLADSTETEITSDLVTRITEIRKQADDLIHTALDTGEFDSVLRAMQRSSDPTLRTTLIHRLAEFEVPPEQIVYQLMQPCDAGTEAALWLCLGTYTPDSLSSEVWQQVVDIASIRYSTAPDSGVHSAIWWLVNHWKQQNISGEFEEVAVSLEASIRHLREQLQLKPIPRDGGWFETLFNETMIVVPAGTTYIIGSPSNEPGRVPDNTDHPEIQRKVTLPVTIAVSATELTQMQFSEAISASIPPPQRIRTAQARSAMSWHEAAWYCNRRSELEGLPIEQHCYVQTAPGPFPWGQYELKENYQHLSGYRLLSEEEWEYCCRAGTTTSRHFGNDDTFASHYMVVAEYGHPQPITSGTRMPNDLGFFDMHGNVAEWVNNPGAGTPRFSRRARGGSILSGIGRIRSALRLAIDADHPHPTMGLRLCRSLVEPGPATPPEVSVDVQVPPHVSALISTADVTAADHPEWYSLPAGEPVCAGTGTRLIVPTRTVRIRNDSLSPMTLGPPTTSGIALVYNQPRTEIAPGEFSEWIIGGSGAILQIGHGVVEIPYSSDTVSGTLRIPVTAGVHGPRLHVFEGGVSGDPSTYRSFDFGDVRQHSEVYHRFSIHNSGDRPLKIHSIEAPDCFHMPRDWDTTVEGGQFTWFMLRVDSDTLGLLSGQIRLVTDDPAQAEFSFPVSANVVRGLPSTVPGVFRDGTWLFDENRDGIEHPVFEFGQKGDRPITGDWNGDGICDLCVCRPGTGTEQNLWTWHILLLGNDAPQEIPMALTFGSVTGTPMLMASGSRAPAIPTVVVPDEENGNLIWHLDADRNGEPDPEKTIPYGSVPDVPIAADLDGDGVTEIGFVRKSNSHLHNSEWHFRRPELAEDVVMQFSVNIDTPVVGDWNGDGKEEPGAFRSHPAHRVEWFLNLNSDALSEQELEFGRPGDVPVTLASPVDSYQSE